MQATVFTEGSIGISCGSRTSRLRLHSARANTFTHTHMHTHTHTHTYTHLPKRVIGGFVGRSNRPCHVRPPASGACERRRGPRPSINHTHSVGHVHVVLQQVGDPCARLIGKGILRPYPLLCTNRRRHCTWQPSRLHHCFPSSDSADTCPPTPLCTCLNPTSSGGRDVT